MARSDDLYKPVNTWHVDVFIGYIMTCRCFIMIYYGMWMFFYHISWHVDVVIWHIMACGCCYMIYHGMWLLLYAISWHVIVVISHTMACASRALTTLCRFAGYIMSCGWFFATLLASLPLMGISDYRKFAVCLPFEVEDPVSLGRFADLFYKLKSLQKANKSGRQMYYPYNICVG